MADPDYYRKQAEIFARIAARRSVPELVGYYDGLARNYLAQADGGDAFDCSAPPAPADDGATEAPETDRSKS
jgi:hypothetical protein